MPQYVWGINSGVAMSYFSPRKITPYASLISRQSAVRLIHFRAGKVPRSNSAGIRRENGAVPSSSAEMDWPPQDKIGKAPIGASAIN
jgi:hypothetical protein